MEGRKLLSLGGLLVVLAVGVSVAFRNRRARFAGHLSGDSCSGSLITSASPRSVQWPAMLEASGSVAPWQEASIGTQIGGYRLIDVRVNVGDQVKKGQLLAVLDPDLLRSEEAQLEATATKRLRPITSVRSNCGAPGRSVSRKYCSS